MHSLRPLLPKWHFTTVGSDHLGWGRTAQLNSKLCEPMAVDVSSWHETDMLTAVRDVRSQGQSGKHILAVSFSGFDPEQKSATSKVSSVDRSLKVGGRHRVAVIVAAVLERVRRPARLASDKGS
jgi:hypothetical protein